MKSFFAAVNPVKNRKAILSSVVFLFLIHAMAHAQSSAEPKLHFGMKLQPALAWLKTDTKGIENNGSAFRFTYGFITEFKFAERYSLVTGIDISNRGGSTRSTTTNVDTTVIIDKNWKLRYLELPFTLKLKTNEIGYLTYYLQFGIAPGFNIRAVADVDTTTTKPGASKTASEDKVDVGKDVTFFNLSMIIGLGAEYRFSGNTALFGGITFSNGFLDIASDNNTRVNSNHLGLSVGVLF